MQYTFAVFFNRALNLPVTAGIIVLFVVGVSATC